MRTHSARSEFLASYDAITANSGFSAHWIARNWNRESRIVYSASELVPARFAMVKEKIILAMGRHHVDKRLEVLIDAFRELPELRAGWEFHLAGAVAPYAREYVTTLEQRAHGIPVFFHRDLSVNELHTIYGRSAIYWHAKGFGVPEDEPEWMEHFGNGPIEARSAGCVPVVFNGGGLVESVDHGVNGFLWNTVEELKTQTLRLARDPVLLASMSARARQLDDRYGVEPFLNAMDAIVDETLGGTPCRR